MAISVSSPHSHEPIKIKESILKNIYGYEITGDASGGDVVININLYNDQCFPNNWYHYITKLTVYHDDSANLHTPLLIFFYTGSFKLNLRKKLTAIPTEVVGSTFVMSRHDKINIYPPYLIGKVNTSSAELWIQFLINTLNQTYIAEIEIVSSQKPLTKSNFKSIII